MSWLERHTLLGTISLIGCWNFVVCQVYAQKFSLTRCVSVHGQPTKAAGRADGSPQLAGGRASCPPLSLAYDYLGGHVDDETEQSTPNRPCVSPFGPAVK